MKYDVLIVGAGPGGIFAAYELMNNDPEKKIAVFEAGHPLEKRKCPIDGKKVKSCIHCKTCAIMKGFGGAGAFSDGKYNITNQFGGTLYQDLPEQVSNSISHHQIPPYDQPVHTVSVLPETPLAALLEQETLAVNSYHHQGILKLAEALQPMAVAPDGLIESVWLPEKAFVWGVQWHPEYDYQKNVAGQQIFQTFVQAAGKQEK